ncbi:MAG: nucleotidyl transferase AbiEii/AbiGii toxin family protein [Planctomycetota bacterium]|nr:nucleotidyl transferase AbiEii/AbiGii toxin family protein [Planctomycetota bacterium]
MPPTTPRPAAPALQIPTFSNRRIHYIFRPPLTSVRCIDATEALAEKFRAALTRREVAIRDFYDIAHVVKNLGVRPLDDDFLEMIRQKLAVPGNEAINVSQDRLSQLRAQLDGRLKPVLRRKDFEGFDLDGTFTVVRQIARAVLGG